MESAQKLAVPISIVVAGALIAGAIYLSNTRNAGAPQVVQQPKVNIKDVKIAGEPFIGDVNAPVTMAYWADYQCPFCKAVEVGGVPQIPTPSAIPLLIKNYVDTGKLKIVFKDFPFLGNDSTTAALYEHAVWELYPDKFYSWRSAMFKAQDEEGDQGFGNEASILKLIAKIQGLDANRLKALVAEKKDIYSKAIDADREEGSKFGVKGTPGFIIGTKFIAGADQLSTFTSAIEALLKK